LDQRMLDIQALRQSGFHSHTRLLSSDEIRAETGLAL